MGKETHNPVWMVWQVKSGSYPALRAICTEEKIAERYRKLAQTSNDGTICVEKNLTNHLYGQFDMDISALMIRNNQRRRHEGD